MPRPLHSLVRLACLLAALGAAPVSAQSYGSAPPRYGAAFDTWVAIPGQEVIPNGPAVGLRVRGALPVNADVSVAADLGLGAHLFDGRDNAQYVLNPQTMVIVTLPGGRSVRYVLGGLGGYLPLTGGAGGPTIHAGFGWAVGLSETSVFFEANPSVLIGEAETTVVLAARAGVIF